MSRPGAPGDFVAFLAYQGPSSRVVGIKYGNAKYIYLPTRYHYSSRLCVRATARDRVARGCLVRRSSERARERTNKRKKERKEERASERLERDTGGVLENESFRFSRRNVWYEPLRSVTSVPLTSGGQRATSSTGNGRACRSRVEYLVHAAL